MNEILVERADQNFGHYNTSSEDEVKSSSSDEGDIVDSFSSSITEKDEPIELTAEDKFE